MSSSGTYTPAGSVTVTTSGTTNKTAPVSSTTGTATYTPAGEVSAPTISVKTAGTTASINNPTKVTVAKTVTAVAPGATAPSNEVTYYSVSGEVLSFYQLGYTTGDSITTSGAIFLALNLIKYFWPVKEGRIVFPETSLPSTPII